MLVVDKQDIELGTLKKGVPHSFKYTVTNNGPSDIRIDRVSVSCGSCTLASINARVIKAGKSALVDVTFTPSVKGNHNKHVDILYGGHRLKLEFKATVDG